jgi:hypothetical protein
METLVEIITELRLEVSNLKNQIEIKELELEKEKESKLFWYKKSLEFEAVILKAKENE